MPILKTKTHRSAEKDAVVLDLGDLGRQAAKLRAIAEAKAEAILTAARDEATRLTQGAAEAGDQRGYAEGLERGRAEGFEAGKAEAKAQLTKELAALHTQWSDAVASYEERFALLEREARAATLELAVKLAEKVTHRRIDADATLVIDQLAAAFSHVLEPARVKVRIHPQDRPTLAEAMPHLLERFDHVAHAELIDDDTVGRGGCVLSNGPCTIDARIDLQLDRLASLLLGPPPAEAPEASKADVDADVPGPNPDPRPPNPDAI